MSPSPSILIVAAEASSAAYAERLLELWRDQGKKIEAFGVGNLAMEKLGLERFGKAEEMAIVGLVEVIQHYSFLKNIYYSLLDEAKRRKPKVAILMDYPDFNLRLAKDLKALGIEVIYYISPQVWVWRQGRVELLKKYCAKVLLLFPFEVEFYKSKNVPYEFVGHPLLDELRPELLDPEQLKIRRQRYGFSAEDRILALMPGSRNSELKAHFPTQLQAARILCKKYPQIKVIVLVAPNFAKEEWLPYLADFRTPYVLLKDDPFYMISLADLVLVASGTATLMVGLMEKPMVIMYKMKWLTALIAKFIVRGAKFFGLVNLLHNREVVPELFQEKASAEKLAAALEKYLLDESYRQGVVKDLTQLRFLLGDRGVTQRVAKVIEKYLDGPGGR